MKRINPNFVTSLRISIFAPLACVFLMHDCLPLALVSMLLGEFTDFLDGFVARRTNQVTDIGKIFDPMCDSLFHMTIWITFLAKGWVPIYLVLLFLFRDSVVSTMRIHLAKSANGKNVDLGARKSGKVKAVFQASAQIVLVVFGFFLAGRSLANARLIAALVAAAVTTFSFYDYSKNFYRIER